MNDRKGAAVHSEYRCLFFSAMSFFCRAMVENLHDGNPRILNVQLQVRITK